MVREYKKYIGIGEDNFGFRMAEDRHFSDDKSQMLYVDFLIKDRKGEEVIFEDVWEYDWKQINEKGR